MSPHMHIDERAFAQHCVSEQSKTVLQLQAKEQASASNQGAHLSMSITSNVCSARKAPASKRRASMQETRTVHDWLP